MRKKVNSSKVMKSISFALAVMVAGTTIMPMSVEAVDDHGYGYVDENKQQYNDTEKSNNADAEAMTDAANQAKEAAKEASDLLDDVNKELDATKDAVEEIQAPEQKDGEGNVIKDAVNLPGDATKAAEKAKTAADDAAAKAENVNDAANELKDKTNAYNEKVAEDQAQIDAEVKAVDGTLTVTVTDENNQEQTKALDEYVEEKKSAAEAAKDAAHKALGEALAIDADEATQEVKDKAAEVTKAAEEAKAAADAAEKEYKEAEDAYQKSITTYNYYAMMYGLPLYGETDITYGEDDLKEAGITQNQKETKEELEDKKKEILDTNLTGLKTTIDNQADTIKDLSETVDAAQKAAVEAQEVADKLVNGEKDTETTTETKGLKDYVEDANKAYTEVADHYVAPAKEAEKKAQDALDQAKDDQKTVNAEQNEIIEEQEILKGQEQKKVTAKAAEKNNILNSDVYKNATSTIEKGNENANIWGTSVIERQREIQGKKKGDRIWNGYYFEKLSQKDIDNAKAYVKAYDDAANYVKDADAKAKALDAEIAQANANITDAENKIAAANNVMQNKQDEVDVRTNNLNQSTANREAAEAVRDEYVKAAEEALKQQRTDALIDEIQKVLAERSDAVNQVEFDRDLNEWANGTLEKYQDIDLNWKFWETVADIAKVANDSKEIRDYMDTHYEAHDNLIDFINYLELTQWIVSTDDTEAVMEAAIKVYREQMKQNEEKLATIEAYLANVSANTSGEAAEEALKQMANYVAIANAAKQTLTEAAGKVQDAQKAYNEAEKKLKDAQETASKVQLDDIKMAELLDKIAKAKELLDASKDNLEAAKASAQLAENYNHWAQKLITDQYTNAYAQKTSEGLANSNYWEYDMTDADVSSRGSGSFVQVSDSKVVIPYEVYRNYLASLYNKYPDSAITETRGKGISTGGSMQVVYWLMDENNKLTGEYTLDENALISGKRYFIAYALKVENDGYHMDGYAFDFTRNEEVIPGGEDGDNGNGGNNVNGGNGGAVVGGGTLTPAVLGAQREQEPAAEQTGDVLGATRAPETTGDVLGENRPQTSDDTNAWGAAAGAAVSGLLLAGYMAVKKKEVKIEEQC